MARRAESVLVKTLCTSSEQLIASTNIESFAPGLYDIKIDNPTGDPDCRKGAYTLRVRAVSEQLEDIYTRTLSKWVQAMTTRITAAAMEWLHPMRVARYMFGSSFSPFMLGIAAVASAIRDDRHAVSNDAPLKKAETVMFVAVREALTEGRTIRDEALERLFDRLYSSGAIRRNDATKRALAAVQ